MTEDIRLQILDLDDTQIEEVYVPEWNTTVRVRGMTGTQRAKYLAASTVERQAENRAARRKGLTTTDYDREFADARLVAWCVVSDKGNRVFMDDDIEAINKKNASAIKRIVDVAIRLSGLDDDEVPDKVDQVAEEMLENPTDASSSA